MKGATKLYKIINKAYNNNLEGLRKLKFNWSGGDSEAFINGNIIYVTSSHARGECFHIYLIEDTNYTDEQIRNNAFEVYGIIGGQPGWTEEYGWLREGAWVGPILKYLNNLEKQNENIENNKYKEQLKLKSEKDKKAEERSNIFNELFKNI